LSPQRFEKTKSFSQLRDASDKNFLLLNSNFAGLVEAIHLKSQSKPELGRILTDKKYKEAQAKPKEVALWCFVKQQQKS
jgi:hypothetical protein